MQISYHSSFTKIQITKLKKKKKKKLISVLPDTPGIGWNARNWPIQSMHNWYGQYLNRYETSMIWYPCTYRYSTYRQYRPVRYGIDHLGLSGRFIFGLHLEPYFLPFWFFFPPNFLIRFGQVGVLDLIFLHFIYDQIILWNN